MALGFFGVEPLVMDLFGIPSGLAEMVATEQSAASEYDQLSKENEIEKATKDQDVKYSLHLP